MRCLALLAISLSLAKCQSSKEDVCKYSCLDEGRCQVRYRGPSRSGYTKGVCFRRGGCVGTPQECQDCNLVKNCDISQEEEFPANGKFPNTEISCLNEDGSSNCQQASDCPTPDGCVKVKKGFKSIIEGNYVQSSPPPSNNWHYVSIRRKVGSENIFTWRNKAGVEWDLIFVEEDWRSGVFKFQIGENCPYNTVEHGYTEARLFTNNGIEIEGPHGIYTKECCDRIVVASKWTSLSGSYTKLTKTHNGKAVYQRSGDRYCIFFGGHWKIEACDWMEKGDNSQGLAFTKVLDEVCPERIGLQWRYFKSGVGGFSGFDGATSQGPIDNGIKVTCD